MKKLISAFAVFIALCELSGCGIKGKLYIEPEYTQLEDEESSSEQNSNKSSKSDESLKKNQRNRYYFYRSI